MQAASDHSTSWKPIGLFIFLSTPFLFFSLFHKSRGPPPRNGHHPDLHATGTTSRLLGRMRPNPTHITAISTQKPCINTQHYYRYTTQIVSSSPTFNCKGSDFITAMAAKHYRMPHVTKERMELQEYDIKKF
jgi:hypothetical protein